MENIVFKNTGDKDVVFKKVRKPPVWMIIWYKKVKEIDIGTRAAALHKKCL